MTLVGKCALPLLFVIAACATKQPNHSSPPQTVAAVSSAEVANVTPAGMLRHELLGIAVRDAVIRGDLPSARRDAFQLASLDIFASGPSDYKELAGNFRHRASAIAAAEDVRTAARGVGQLAKSCSDCHARLQGPTRTEVEAKPFADEGRRGEMKVHAWAMRELWNGIIGNSEPPWHEGAVALAGADLGVIELSPEKASTGAPVNVLAASVHDLGRRAAVASDPDVRAAIYGDLLATCASCHRRTR